MINFFRFCKFDDGYLITNDFGMFEFLKESEFQLLLKDEIDESTDLYRSLEEKLFIYQGEREAFLQKVKEYSRTSRSYLFVPTTLFIFVVTTKCNMACRYCQANSPRQESWHMMTEETAKKAVDLVFSSPSSYISIEFQGGEPLMNWDVVRFITLYSEEKATETGKDVSFSVVSNLSMMNDEIYNFMKEHKISISTSLDGDIHVHDYNRPYRNGQGSFRNLSKAINRIHEDDYPIGAIETTTKRSLGAYKQLIDTYVEHSLHSIFLRPLTPLGIANRNWDEIGYEPEEFISFYRDCLQYLLEVNRKGYEISEGHAKMFLSKILLSEGINYMELRSPCGAGIGQIAIYHDGRIFTCDEGRMLAEMGDDAFLLGTVDSTYDSLIDSDVCKSVCASSLLEGIPECCDCVYSPYCGTCPVVNYALNRDIFPNRPNNYRCKIYKGMLEELFRILKDGNEDNIRILQNWACR